MFILSLLLLTLVALAAVATTYTRKLRDAQSRYHADEQRASRLRQQLTAESARRNELEALISSMAEGVLAIDLSGRLLNFNRAGAQLMGSEHAAVIGQPLHEVFRHSGVQHLLETTLAQGQPLHDELKWSVPGESLDRPRSLQAQTAPLNDGEGERIGALVVLHDVTQVRRLESVRREFVANVSHEVKTPVAAIKAAVETLLDDREASMPREDAVRFLRIVARQADRLDAIVEDLLALARIEQTPPSDQQLMPPGHVAPVLAAAAETCAAKAQEKNITLDVHCDAALQAKMTPSMIEQAVTNLIDNAIKYSPAHTTVQVTGARDQETIAIKVTDQGRGIDPEHLDRVFERFYRTDRARSRALGGTGLGLSIVKHIAQAHGGRVDVQSRAGHGSTFGLYLVAPETAEHPTDTSDA